MRGLSAIRRARNSGCVSDRLVASRPARRCKETTPRTLRQPYPRRRPAHRPSRANPSSAIYSQARRRFRRVSIRVRFGCRCLPSLVDLPDLMDRLMTCVPNPLDLVSVPCASKTAVADSGRRTVRRAFFPFRSNWATRMASGSIVAVSITSRVRPACPWSRWFTTSKPVSWGRECSAPSGATVFVAVIRDPLRMRMPSSSMSALVARLREPDQTAAGTGRFTTEMHGSAGRGARKTNTADADSLQSAGSSLVRFSYHAKPPCGRLASTFRGRLTCSNSCRAPV
jgi:hypothetical protein